jgi:hypothetical protein
VGGNDLPLRHKRDAPHQKEREARWAKLAEVDVVLFQGWRPPLSHAAWSQAGVKTLVWFNPGLRKNERVPAGWSLTKKVLSHARAGGITNAMTVVYITMRLGQTSLRWKQRADGFPNTLHQVVDPTLGGRMCEIPVEKDGAINSTAKGLLDWKSRRTAWVTVPTVYSKDRWAVRRLAPQELGHAMDLPGNKIEGINVEVLDKVLNGSVPGKLMALVAASVEITDSGACSKEPHRDQKRKTETEGPPTTKQPKGLFGSKELENRLYRRTRSC